MRHWLDKLTDLAVIKGDESILKKALANFTAQAGFQGYAYLHFQPGHTIAETNYHPEWRETYFRLNFAAVDPVVKRAKSLKQAFTWSGEQDRHRLSKPERAFYSQASDFGIRSGITIPVKTANGSMSMFTLASDKPLLDLGRDIDSVAAA
ncbi:MAG TPA: transcriptional regulator TraR, partial [Ochrobactrum intermedium]